MEKTLNEALRHGKDGNWNKAWEVAQKDDGLLEGTTKDEWIEFAKAAIERRAKEEEGHKREI